MIKTNNVYNILSDIEENNNRLIVLVNAVNVNITNTKTTNV